MERYYPIGQLAKFLGIRRGRVRKAFVFVLRSKGLDVKSFIVRSREVAKQLGIDPKYIHPNGTFVIPQHLLREVLERLVHWDIEISFEGSQKLSRTWGLIIVENKEKHAFMWKVEGNKLKIGSFDFVERDLPKKVLKLFVSIHPELD